MIWPLRSRPNSKSRNRFFVWQRRLGFGPPPELLVDPLQRIGRAQRLPLRKRESGKGEEFVAGLLEAGADRSAPQLPFVRKPDPRAFLAAAEALDVSPVACIMVGDRIDNDIVPAKALGMAAIQLRSGRHRRQQPRSPAETPDAVVTDVLELEAAIFALLDQ